MAIGNRASVVLFPQGSRSGGGFRAGVGRIAAGGATEVVPIHIAGADRILPRGAVWPCRSDVVITIGEPTSMHSAESPAEFALRLEHMVLDELSRAS